MITDMNTHATDANYEYVTARVRSRRAKLFGDEDYRKLVRMGPGEIARFIAETEYKVEMDALGSRLSGVSLIEHALHRNLAKDFEDLLRWAEGPLYDYIARYLRKFDAWNVKTALRGTYSDIEREAVELDMIRAGEFDDRLIEQLLDAQTVEEGVNFLSETRFGPALSEAFEEFEETGVLVPLENAVDRTFYTELLSGFPTEPSRATSLYIEFLEAEIDFRNVRNALRIARSEADIAPETYFIPGGRLFDEGEIGQLVGSTDQLTARIRGSHYGDDITDALDDLEESSSLIGFERALERALLEYTQTLSNRYPLSVCPVFTYILLKEHEVDNIRAIARGKGVGLSPEEVNEELVIV